MSEAQGPVLVAVNVMRARLTVLGFNLAIITFQMNKLRDLPASSAVHLPGIESGVHLSADFALFVGFALTVIAMVAFIASGALDKVGLCNHWSLVAGDLLMYQALAQTVSGFFVPFLALTGSIVAQQPEEGIRVFHLTLLTAGGAAWFLAAYAGPAVALFRSPFGRRATLSLGVGYAVLVIVLSIVGAKVSAVQGIDPTKKQAAAMSAVMELVQPLRW